MDDGDVLFGVALLFRSCSVAAVKTLARDVRAPDLNSSGIDLANVRQRGVVLEVVGVGDLPRLPDALQHSKLENVSAWTPA